MASTVTVESQFERLAQIVAPDAKLLRIWPLGGGLSAQMIAFEVEYPDGHLQKMIVRQPSKHTLQAQPQAAEEQFRLLQITQSLGLSTPKPLYCDPSGEIFGAPSLVIEYIPGKMDFSPSNLPFAMVQFAEYLVKIHRVPAAKADLKFLAQRKNRCGELANRAPDLLNKTMQEGRIREALLSMGALTRENTAVLLHGDYWPGNVLWQDDKLVAVIDWEDAALGDPLIDLAISRLDLVWIFGINAMHTFTNHYQSQIDIDYSGLPYWDLCAALRLIRLAGSNLAAWVAFFVLYGRSDITVQSLLTNYRYFINQACEKLAHASR